MTHKEQLQFHLAKIKWRYTIDRFFEDIYSILIHMSVSIAILLSIGIFLHISEIVRFSHPQIAINFAIFMIAVTCIVYSLWNVFFYRKSLTQIVTTLDQSCGMDEEFVYACDILKHENDIVFQYLAQKILNKKNMWQNKIKTNILQNLTKISVILLIFCGILWLAQKQNFIAIYSHVSSQKPQNKNTVASSLKDKEKKQDKQDKQKKQQDKQDKQKKQQDKQDKGKNKNKEKGKQTKQPALETGNPKQQQQQPKQNPKEEKDKKAPAPGNNKGNDKEGDNKNKELPDVKSEDKSLSPLFGEGKNHDSYANTGGKGENDKKETQQLEEYYRNLEKLPIFFKKQFIPVEDQLAIKRYFNMIRPQQGK